MNTEHKELLEKLRALKHRSQHSKNELDRNLADASFYRLCRENVDSLYQLAIEADSLRSQLAASQERERGMREALEGLTEKNLMGPVKGGFCSAKAMLGAVVNTAASALQSTPSDAGREDSQVGRWAWSTNGERYDSESYSDPMEAAAAGFEYMDDDCDEGQSIHVGRVVKPDVSGHIHAESIVEHIAESECFDNDWADDWPSATRAQMDDLSERLQNEFKSWMKRHGLEPNWFTIEDDREVTRDEVKAWEATQPPASPPPDDHDGAPYCQYCGAKEKQFCKCGPIAKNH